MKISQRLQNSVIQDNKIRKNLISTVSIYSKNHISDPIHNIESLKIFNQIDIAFSTGNKKLLFDSICDFIKNENGIYNSEYGKAKDHLESLISYNNNIKTNIFKLTTYDLFSNFGVSDKVISNLNITKPTRTDTITKFYEYLTSEAIKNKYTYVTDVITYSPGKIKIPYFNGTKQNKFDLLVAVEDFDGNIIYIAFDHKVKDLQSCIKDIENNGLKYSIFTLGDIEDQIFYESSAVKEQLSNHNYTEVYDSNNKIIYDKILKVEVTAGITYKDMPKFSETAKKVLRNLNDYENDHDIMLRTPLIPTMLVNSKDLANVLAKLTSRNPNNSFVDLSENV